MVRTTYNSNKRESGPHTRSRGPPKMFRPSKVTRKVRPVLNKRDPALEKSLEKVRELSAMYRESISPEFQNVGLPWSDRLENAFEWLKKVVRVCEKHEHGEPYLANVKSALACYESKVVPREEEEEEEEEPSEAQGPGIPITFKCLDGTEHRIIERKDASFHKAADAYAKERKRPITWYRFLAPSGGSNHTIDKRSKIAYMPQENELEGVCVSVAYTFGARINGFSPPPHCLFSSQTVLTKHGTFELSIIWTNL